MDDTEVIPHELTPDILIAIGTIIRTAGNVLLQLTPLQIVWLALGVSVTIVLSIVYLWKHVKEARSP